VSGNTHSFWAGLASAYLPPRPFEPVGVAFVTGSISAIGFVEAMEHVMPATHPLRKLYVGERPMETVEAAPVNMLLRHGIQSVLNYLRTGDVVQARKLSNGDLNPHLSFVDLAGHGYSVVRATSSDLECEFVCIPRPIVRSTQPDGGPLRYRVLHRTRLWKAGETPQLEQIVLAGDPVLSL
jgi:alkaline phosphatase D